MPDFPTNSSAQSKVQANNPGAKTVDKQKNEAYVAKPGRPVMVLFIGGAGDKESYYGSGPNGNIEDVLNHCNTLFKTLLEQNLYFTKYLGYNEVCGDRDIQKNVIQHIPDKRMPIYIVGHSLGAWNGAHLSGILNELGYHIEMLITLDPVGQGIGVNTFSDLHRKEPAPAAKFWINIRAKRQRGQMDISDRVAMIGGQWMVTEGPHLNYIVDVHHALALTMFATPLKGKAGARDYFYQSVKKITAP